MALRADELRQIWRWLQEGYKEVETRDGKIEKVKLTQKEVRAYQQFFTDMDRERQAQDMHELNQRAIREAGTSSGGGVDEESFRKRFES